jgi:hypothetical protein
MIYLKLLPYALGVLLAGGAWFHGKQTGYEKAYKNAMTIVTKMDKQCPDCNCPEQKPCNGIDFDKIKSRNITIENRQYLTVSGDSTLLKRITEENQKVIADLKAEMQRLKLSKCK